MHTDPEYSAAEEYINSLRSKAQPESKPSYMTKQKQRQFRMFEDEKGRCYVEYLE